MSHPKISPPKDNVVNRLRPKNCLKCGHPVILEKGFFLCEACRKSNSHLEDSEAVHIDYLPQGLRVSRSRRPIDNR